MNPERFYLSTIAEDAPQTARKFGMGLEIAEYCTAWNLDDEFVKTDASVQKKLTDIPHRLLHAPFNELFPCAIDRRARQLAADRYRQSIETAERYHAEKVIIHGGYQPTIYYPVWYTEQSVLFWKEFFSEADNMQIVLENVFETDPQMLLSILQGVDDPRLRMCLDIGHVNAYSPVSVFDWLNICAPYISHFHIHNNDGSADTHSALMQGGIPMREFLLQAQALCPQATFTLELTETSSSVNWLWEEL